MKRVACLLLLLAGCGQGPPAAQPAGPAAAETADELQPGIHQLTFDSSAGPVDYTIVVPSSYRADVATPLIVALHFGGEVTPFYGGILIDALVAPGLSELEAVIVAPDSVGGDWTTEDNEQAVLELFEEVASRWNIDRSRTLLTGFSMGGKGTWHLGGRHQDLFRAAIPVAGSPIAHGGPPTLDWQIPLYVINSEQDTVMPLQVTRDHVEKLQSRGADVHLEVVTGIGHFQTHRFAEPLKQAVPWVRQAWARAAANGN